ncbi:eCIS core domain-containing protein [Desulfobacter curvatus]|uniref:eCIS core domain-containing protein n=1 Tax=Desulfobacter curvatus TaxID=2290 RepID=UPI000378CE89|nr:DUF4157 domain-containing protein [Desulfobacter curvatus]
MRTFADKQKPARKAKAQSPVRPRWAFTGQSCEVTSILHLQRTIGNHAVQRLLQNNVEEREENSPTSTSLRYVYDFSRIPVHANAPTMIQSELTVNTPGDMHEKEADQVADEVMKKTETMANSVFPAISSLQRQVSNSHTAVWAPNIVREVINSPGEPLAPTNRSFFEPRFGHDFSRVRVHTDTIAAKSAQSVNAQAFTLGNHIVFDSNKFAPHSYPGKRLIAHELTHVVQQQGTSSISLLQRHSCRKNEGPPTAEPPIPGEDGPHPLIYRGTSTRRSRRPSVGYAQELLNRFLGRLTSEYSPCAAKANIGEIDRIRATLNQDPLEVDCRFGPNTEKATKMFQRCMFPGSKNEWDGKIGKKTWPALKAYSGGIPVPPVLSDDTIVRIAKAQRDAAMFKALKELQKLKQTIENYGGLIPSGKVTQAVYKWLLADVYTFMETIETAIAIIERNIEIGTRITIDRSQKKNYAHVGAIGDPSKGIIIEDRFFGESPECQRELIAHEFFHLSGLVHAYGTTNRELAINCPHHMAELVFDIATGVTERCGKPPIICVLSPVP